MAYGQLGSRIAEAVSQHSPTGDGEQRLTEGELLVTLGACPCGTDVEEFVKAVNITNGRLTDGASEEERMIMPTRADMHHTIYSNWHAYYLKGGRKTFKRRKTKVKQCLIDDCMRHLKVPNSIKEALLHEFADNFIEACEIELKSHDDNGTWTLVPKEEWMNIVGSTWSFDIKRDMKKRILRFKARLCAQGFTQVKGIDYFRKFSHTVPLDVLRLFLTKCSIDGLEVTEADYTTAYLNAKVDTSIYMSQPPYFHAANEDGSVMLGPNGEELVCKLDKAIYGLVQSGLMWETEHHKALRDRGWTQCDGEPCLFSKVVDDKTVYLVTYVDNLFLGFPPGHPQREKELASLAEAYKITDLGTVSFSLGARVVQNTRIGHTTIDQQPYIDELLATYGADISEKHRHKYRSVPSYEEVMEITKGEPDDPETATWIQKCLELGGKLNYIAVFTRPDISASLSFCMRNVSGATRPLYLALINIVKYLRDTKHYKLHLGKGLDRPLREFLVHHSRTLVVDPWRDGDLLFMCDASQGGARPMMCAIGFIAGCPFVWKIGRLTSTTLSSCEAEWFGQTAGATLFLALLPVLSFLGFAVVTPIISFCDNESAVNLSIADHSTKRMKHVLTRMAFLQERIDEGSMVLIHVDTDGMIADIGTKVLGPTAFHNLRRFLVYE